MNFSYGIIIIVLLIGITIVTFTYSCYEDMKFKFSMLNQRFNKLDAKMWEIRQEIREIENIAKRLQEEDDCK